MPKCTGFRMFVLRPCLQLLANSCQLKQYHDFLIWWIHLRSESRDQATSADYKVFTSSNFQLIHSQGKVKGREAAWIYVTFTLPSVTKDKIFQILHTILYTQPRGESQTEESWQNNQHEHGHLQGAGKRFSLNCQTCVSGSVKQFHLKAVMVSNSSVITAEYSSLMIHTHHFHFISTTSPFHFSLTWFI